MDHRLQLQKTLEGLDGVIRVYFEPNVNTKMEFPCIKYDRSGRPAEYANNKRYIQHEQYTIIFITRNTSTAIKVIEQLEEIPFMLFNRHYTADGLEHYVYTKTY